MRVCKDCRHFDCRVEVACAEWYDMRCGNPNVTHKPGSHPQTGEPCYWKTNDLGRDVPMEEKRPHAREINPDGKCFLFEFKRAKRRWCPSPKPSPSDAPKPTPS